MTRNELLNILLRRAGQRESDSTLKTQMIEELKLAQETFEFNGVPLPNAAGAGIFWPNFLISEIHDTSTTKDEARLTLPQGFLAEAEEGSIFRVNSGNWIMLAKDWWDELRAEFEKTGKPTHYARMGDYIYLAPTPDDVYTIKMVFYKAEDRLDTNIENGWTKEGAHLMIGWVGSIMAAQYLHNDRLAQSFTTLYQNAAMQLHHAEVAKDHANFFTQKDDMND